MDILWRKLLLKIWYYKPWAYHPKVNPQYVFDKDNRCVLEEREKPEVEHPLNRIAKVKIKSSMVEVPND